MVLMFQVVTTWRSQGCTKGSLPDGDPLSSPGGLLCCALALVIVQAFLAGGWLLLVPADIEPPTSLDGLWTCAAASGRELLSSLSFLGALLITTAFVSVKARKDGESRSILVCCVLLALAGGAWVAAANSSTLAEHHRDCVAGVVAGLVSATLVLLCVFVPKLLQHARLSREQERQQHHAAAMMNHSKLQPVMYGVPHYPSVSSPHTLVIKAFPGKFNHSTLLLL
jgi:cytochrome bd-type quinol oxidase subunit 2